MFNNCILVLMLINFLIVTLIFWLITLIELGLNTNSDNPIKNDVYECGFKTVNKVTFPVTLNTIVLLLFVVIYEIEFIALLPVFLNFKISIGGVIILFLFLFWIIIVTLYLDVLLKKIYWVY